MTTILILNGISLATASGVIGTLIVRARRRLTREARVQPVYVTTARRP